MSTTRARFGSALMIISAGALLAAGAFTFTPHSERWLALGAGGAALIVLLVAFAVPGRGAAQRALDPLLALTCVWTIVCSRVIESSGAGSSGHDIKWWGFASGAAICGFGLLGLLLHEWRVERELRRADEPERRRHSGQPTAQPRPLTTGRALSVGRESNALSRAAR